MRWSDLVGQRFGRLVVASLAPPQGDEGRRWRCVCDCGGETVQTTKVLRKGAVKSCGCARREWAVKLGSASKHGMTKTPEYKAWRNAADRCTRPSHKQYAGYGGRGITFYEGWIGNFQAFFDHIGPRPTSAHSLDRIDNERGYEPGNVRWATFAVQANNKRSNHIVEIDGQTMTLAEAIRLKGLRSNVVRQRLAIGWPMERALNATPRQTNHRAKQPAV